MDNLCLGCKGIGSAGNPVIKADADRNQKVAGAGGLVGPLGSVHSDHSQAEGIGSRKRTHAHE